MTIQTRAVAYDVGGLACEAFVAWDDRLAYRPGVLVSPTVRGRTAFEEDKAERLARLGYVGMVVDIYGRDAVVGDFAQARAAMEALNGDRAVLGRRIAAAHATLKALPEVDEARTAAIGYCFGGKCVLDLARSGADVAGVASFHGLFDPPPFATAEKVFAKVLALHGWNDPLVPPERVLALADELTAKGADWQIHAYGHTVHGFTNPANPEMYHPDADRRSWAAMTGFLEELFG